MTPVNREDCHDACVVAMENKKDIATAFIRLDEEREERKKIPIGVSLKMFTWVIGSITSVAVVIACAVAGTMWTSLSTKDLALERATQEISNKVAQNSGKIDVVVVRINDFMTQHEAVAKRAGDDQVRVLDKLDKITDAVHQISIKVSKLEKGN